MLFSLVCAAAHSRQNQFLPLGVPINKALPSVSISIGLNTSYHAIGFTSPASSMITKAAVGPRALSGLSRERNMICPPSRLPSVGGKSTVIRVLLNCATLAAALHISSHATLTCVNVGAPHMTGRPLIAASAAMDTANVVLRHLRPAERTLMRRISRRTSCCPLCGYGSRIPIKLALVASASGVAGLRLSRSIPAPSRRRRFPPSPPVLRRSFRSRCRRTESGCAAARRPPEAKAA